MVPITFITFFQYVHYLGPKHCKRFLFDILSNPVPGVKFDGRIGESKDFASLKWCWFNQNLVARKIAQDKHLSAKQATRSSTVIIHGCPMAHINNAAPVLSGYQMYATYYKTSMGDDVVKSEYSMPITLHFAICDFSCPEIVFSSLPRWPPDGIIMAFIIMVFIESIFSVMAIQTCFNISVYSLRKLLLAEIKAAALRHQTDRLNFWQPTTTHVRWMPLDTYGTMVFEAL